MPLLKKTKPLFAFDNPFELLAHAVLFRKTRLSVHRINGVEAIVDNTSSDAGSIRTCIAEPMYRDFIPKMALDRAPITFIDLGANAGGFPLMFKVLGTPIKKFVCVEFNPYTYVRLLFNIKYNFGPDFLAEVLNAAVCDDGRTIEADLGRGDTSDSIYRGTRDAVPTASNRHHCAVPGVTLNDLVAKYFDPDQPVDILKMDIEGAEQEVLLGANNQALARCRYLIAEFHEHAQFPQLIAAVERHGLRTIVEKEEANCGVFLFANNNL